MEVIMNRKHFRRIFSAVLTLIMVFTLMAPFANAASASYLYYSDVESTSPYYTAVNYLYEHGIMNGTGNGKFSPKGNLTRGQLVTVLWRMLDKPAVTTTATFKDCGQTNQYYSAVQWAQSVGIASGYTDGTFRPNQNLTNQELYVFMLRFVRYCGYETWSDTDLTAAFRVRISSNKRDTYQAYARAAAGWVNKEGLLNNTNLAGNALCTRGDVALLVYNIYKVYQKKYGLTVVNTYNLNAASKAGQGMAKMFQAAGAETISRQDIYYSKNSNSFISSMKAAFSKAKALDICYLYCCSHGIEKGLYLFRDADEDVSILSPNELRTEIDKYQGMFVVFIEGCQSGTYIKKGTNDAFDPQDFVTGLTATGLSKRSASNLVDESGRIKVFCSSTQAELSWYNKPQLKGYASDAWLIGCGMVGYPEAYYFLGKELAADVDDNRKISMAELFDFAYDMVIARTFNKDGQLCKQHMVCYPENDDTIIFEIRDCEFIG